MENAEVVVTGVGMITPLGATARASAEAWRLGRRAERRSIPELAGTRLAGAEAATLPDFDAAERLGSRRMLKYMSPAAVLGCIAAREAAGDAEVGRRFRPERVGLFAGTGLAAVSFTDVISMMRESTDEAGHLSYRLLGERGLAAASPLLSFKVLANTAPCLISMQETLRGPSYIFTPWEGQTAAALIEGWRAVATGEIDCALVGGADTPSHPATYVYLRQAGLLNEEESPASGAAYLAVERTDTARRDGRRILARIADMSLEPSDGPARDPVADRIGRTFAAAPAILLALVCQGAGERVSLCGVDRQEFQAELEACP
jgi:3-oxoacyl-[acyl-carrier-protein] synthase II